MILKLNRELYRDHDLIGKLSKVNTDKYTVKLHIASTLSKLNKKKLLL